MPDGGQPAELQESPDQNARGGRRQVPPNSRGVGAFFTTGKRSEFSLEMTPQKRQIFSTTFISFENTCMYLFTSDSFFV